MVRKCRNTDLNKDVFLRNCFYIIRVTTFGIANDFHHTNYLRFILGIHIHVRGRLFVNRCPMLIVSFEKCISYLKPIDKIAPNELCYYVNYAVNMRVIKRAITVHWPVLWNSIRWNEMVKSDKNFTTGIPYNQPIVITKWWFCLPVFDFPPNHVIWWKTNLNMRLYFVFSLGFEADCRSYWTRFFQKHSLSSTHTI